MKYYNIQYYKYICITVVILLLVLLLYIISRKQVNDNNNDPVIVELFTMLKSMFVPDKKWYGMLDVLNDRRILDEIKIYKGAKSYTINKSKIFLCLKDEKDNYYNKNMLMYVLLHEISHCLCDEINHTDKFHKIFDLLLIEAEKCGIYNSNESLIKDYCEYADKK
jgi:hypothetical protein